MLQDMFCEQDDTIARIRWLVDTILDWLPLWMAYTGTMCRDEWLALDLELQKLFVVLEYEQPHHWYSRILCNARYTPWVAKLLVFTIRNADRDGRSKRMPISFPF